MEVRLLQKVSPLWVVAVALIDARGKVLLQQRPSHAEHGGLWEFPGGKVEQGEAPETACVREIAEELGITIDRASLTPVSFASGLTLAPEDGGKKPQRPLIILLYACSVWQGELAALEAQKFEWVEAEAMAGRAMPPLDYPLASALLRHLRQA